MVWGTRTPVINSWLITPALPTWAVAAARSLLPFSVPPRLTTSVTALKNKRETLEAEEGAMRALQTAIKELAEQDMPGNVVKAAQARDEAKVAVKTAEHAVEAATREVAGADRGGGNRVHLLCG